MFRNATLPHQPQTNPLKDVSLWVLLTSNLFTIFLAVSEHWNLETIMLIYWFQSVIIGVFNFVRILSLNEFSTQGFKINDQSVEPTSSTKVKTAFFFLFHYGFFHFIYLIFLLTGTFTVSTPTPPHFADLKYVLLTAALFFMNHLFSYLYNRPRDTKSQNIGSLMFYPYARIIPMHLTIIFGSIAGGALPLFLSLKTCSDVIMHIIEHTILKKNEVS